MLTILLYLLLGIATGTFGTLVGLGGGIILIPVFLLVFGWSAQNVVATSLCVVFFNALSGTLAYIRQKKVYYDAAIRFALCTVPSALIGSYVAHFFTGDMFRTVFGCFMIATAIFLAYRRTKLVPVRDFDPKTFTYNRPLGMFASVGAGFLSSVLGIGGGVIHVPTMIYALKFPAHVAAATSTFVLAVSALVGVVSHFALGHVLLMPALAIGIGAVIGAQLGARISKKTKPTSIMNLLTLAQIIVGLQLILNAR